MCGGDCVCTMPIRLAELAEGMIRGGGLSAFNDLCHYIIVETRKLHSGDEQMLFLRFNKGKNIL